MSADGARWFLCNASPDVHEQLARLAPPCVEGNRHVPVEGIVLTDAELDHSLGIALLREGRSLALWATAPVLHTLEHDSHIVPVTRAFARVETTELQPGGASNELVYRDGTPSGLTVECFTVPGDPPRFASDDSPGHTVGLNIRDEETGGSCAFVPGCGALDDELNERFSSVDALLFDGTFWTEDELVRLGIGDRPAAAMGHLPISGSSGSLAQLAKLPCRHRVYTHINNSNPILIESSPERRAVEEAGLMVGMDGMCINI